MNIEGINEFFFNIIPGTIFILLLNCLFGIDVLDLAPIGSSDFTPRVFILILVGLFLGFIFQALTLLVRDHLNECVFGKVKEENEPEFSRVYPHIYVIPKTKATVNTESFPLKKTFYFMDNVLRAKKAAFLPTHFSSRFAFWSNIMWGSIFLILIDVIWRTSRLPYTSIILLAVAAFSFWAAKKILFNFYDCVFKSFYMIIIKKIELKE